MKYIDTDSPAQKDADLSFIRREMETVKNNLVAIEIFIASVHLLNDPCDIDQAKMALGRAYGHIKNGLK